MERRTLLTGVAAGAAAAALPGWRAALAAEKPVRFGLVTKALGIGFFDAVHKGADEAAEQLGQVKVIFTGPTTTTAEGQIEIINELTAQHVDAMAVSANDPDALVPACKKAIQRGIKVISYDSAVGPGGRIVHLAPSSDALIGQTCAQLVADCAPGAKGKFAVLSATPTSTNQNAWIAQMKKVLPNYPNLTLVGIVYGNDLADQSYRETQALLKEHPDLAVIMAPTSVGIVAGAKAVEDAGLSGKVIVTGLGLPSELIGHVENGTVKEFAIWNPIDLGYTTCEIAVRLARGAPGGPNTTIDAGRMGKIAFDAQGVGVMGKPTIFDKSNIEKYAKIF